LLHARVTGTRQSQPTLPGFHRFATDLQQSDGRHI
jgi:hypothetical protein